MPTSQRSGARSQEPGARSQEPGDRSLAARGSALLAVLWLTAALSVIAFSVATTVRGETERASTAIDGVRAQFLASGAVERGILWVLRGPTYRNPDGSPRYWDPKRPTVRMMFPAGDAVVEVIPEYSKLNLNTAQPQDLLRVLAAMGVEPGRAAEIVGGIVDWRTPLPPNALTALDQYYLSLAPSFRARHASFEEIEEVLLVKGMTPEIYYGGYNRDAQGRLAPRPGFRDCVSVFGGFGPFDVNTAEPPVLVSLGVPPELAARVVELRRMMPLRPEQLAALGLAGFPRITAGLGYSGNLMATIRATARPRLSDGRLSDLRRAAAALVKFYFEPGYDIPYQVLRWYDSATFGSMPQ